MTLTARTTAAIAEVVADAGAPLSRVGKGPTFTFDGALKCGTPADGDTAEAAGTEADGMFLFLFFLTGTRHYPRVAVGHRVWFDPC